MTTGRINQVAISYVLTPRKADSGGARELPHISVVLGRYTIPIPITITNPRVFHRHRRHARTHTHTERARACRLASTFVLMRGDHTDCDGGNPSRDTRSRAPPHAIRMRGGVFRYGQQKFTFRTQLRSAHATTTRCGPGPKHTE